MLYPIETSDTLVYINKDEFDEIDDIKLIEWFILKNINRYQGNHDRLFYIAKCYYYHKTLGCKYESNLQKEIDECQVRIHVG